MTNVAVPSDSAYLQMEGKSVITGHFPDLAAVITAFEGAR
jgi:hypothetical protein